MDEYEGGVNFDPDELLDDDPAWWYQRPKHRVWTRIDQERHNDKLHEQYKQRLKNKNNRSSVSAKKIESSKSNSRGAKIEMQCHCGEKYMARVADLNRGWARSCSKRCASIRREYGRDEAIIAATGKKYK
ncbi:MAG: hypothetical protein ACRDC6_21500 [Shewanella sp.]